MKELIVLTIKNDVMSFSYRSVLEEETSSMNKNTLYKDSLYYELKYYKKHTKDILNFLKMKFSSVNTLVIKSLITFEYASVIINELNIEYLKLDFISTIDVKDYDLFLGLDSLKTIDCYFMVSNIKKQFIDKGVKVITTIESDVSEEFFKQQDVYTLDDLYYQSVINIKEDYPNLLEDLSVFLKINYKLKGIHVYVYSKELISAIVDLVKNDESRNVVVFLHQEYDKGDFIVNNFDWLKDLSDKCKNDYTCEFRILYSKKFISKNLFKQLTFNNLKLILILCIYVSLVVVILTKTYDYIEKMSLQEINNEIIEVIKEDEENENEEGNTEEEKEPSKEEMNTKYKFTNSFKSLKKINNETVGYLVVNNTYISYPVVQHNDNNYYLKKDFYKKKATIGWIYMDYRNNSTELNRNSIIYGHNMLNESMFGSLKKVLSSSWRKKDGSMIITYDTPSESYKFQIFSAYKVNYTTDYLKTDFLDNKDFEKFIKLIKGRSSFKSNVSVTKDDKILTLSTCGGGTNNRLVVHAVLLKEDDAL